MKIKPYIGNFGIFCETKNAWHINSYTSRGKADVALEKMKAGLIHFTAR